MEQSTLYGLNLDFSKELNYTKAIMARQGDKGITVTVKPFLNGLQMDTSGGTFTLKGTTPSNRYVDSVATSVTSEEVTFSLDGTFMSEAGYYKHCYVEYRKGDQILTTQDITFFSLGVSDISQGQSDEYVSQLEELIRIYNETFDAFMTEIESRVDSLNKQINDLTDQAKTLQEKLDTLKEEISKLGNLQVMYSNDANLGDTGEYKYRGIGMRESDNPEEYVWDLSPKYVENNLATDTKISEIVSQANKYTDGKASEINSQLTASINEVDKKVTANTSKIATNITNIKTISDAMPLYAIYSEGRDLTDSPDGTKIPIGALVATDFAHTASDLPYTISRDGITLTATRNCVLFFEGSVKLHGNNTFKFAYVKIRKNGSDTNFANVGSSANLNYVTSQAGQYGHTLVTGDKVEFTLGIDAAAKMFHLQLLSLKISEVKPV